MFQSMPAKVLAGLGATIGGFGLLMLPAHWALRGRGPAAVDGVETIELALKVILDHLGFDTRAVFSLRVRVADEPDWSMGRTWLRVRIGRDVREVCAGHAGNAPGAVHFEPLLPVFPGQAMASRSRWTPFCPNGKE